MSLFRTEVLESRRGNWFGSTILIRPVSFTLLTVLAAFCAGLIILFLFVGEYTKRTQVSGLLVPDRGIVRVMSDQAAIVVERRAKEGQQVKKGDVLLVLSTERLLDGRHLAGGEQDSGVGTHAAILGTVHARQLSLVNEQLQQQRLFAQLRAQLKLKLLNLQAEINQIEQEIATQEERVTAADSQYQRSKNLAERHFLSEQALVQKQDELLDRRSKLEELQRNKLAISRELTSAQNELEQLPIKSSREQSQMLRLGAELKQFALTTEAQRSSVVIAPQDGTVTAIMAEPGQAVFTGQPLLTILPADAKFEAQLYVPSHAAGFIEVGQQVLIRYRAYPYQKFGQYLGKVRLVSQTSLAPQDIPAQLVKNTPDQPSEGLYRVHVMLESQFAMAYGKPQPLVSGMDLDASVIQDTRTLIEWVLDPLYSLKGKVS